MFSVCPLSHPQYQLPAKARLLGGLSLAAPQPGLRASPFTPSRRAVRSLAVLCKVENRDSTLLSSHWVELGHVAPVTICSLMGRGLGSETNAVSELSLQTECQGSGRDVTTWSPGAESRDNLTPS